MSGDGLGTMHVRLARQLRGQVAVDVGRVGRNDLGRCLRRRWLIQCPALQKGDLSASSCSLELPNFARARRSSCILNLSIISLSSTRLGVAHPDDT
jgi:hypothetical protein